MKALRDLAGRVGELVADGAIDGSDAVVNGGGRKCRLLTGLESHVIEQGRFSEVGLRDVAGVVNALPPAHEVQQAVGVAIQALVCESADILADKSLYSYAHSLLHFVRWWESVHHTGDIAKADLTESTLLDYMRFQSSQQPALSATTINDRVATVDRAIRNEFPDAPCQVAQGFHQPFLHRRPMGLGRPRFEISRLRMREPKLNI